MHREVNAADPEGAGSHDDPSPATRRSVAADAEPDLVAAIDATEDFVEGRGYVSEELAIDLVEALRVPASRDSHEAEILDLIEDDVEDLAGRDVVPAGEVTERLEEIRNAVDG